MSFWSNKAAGVCFTLLIFFAASAGSAKAAASADDEFASADPDATGAAASQDASAGDAGAAEKTPEGGAAPAGSALSESDKQKIRAALYFLLESDKTAKKRAEQLRRKKKARKDPERNLYQAIFGSEAKEAEESEESAGLEQSQGSEEPAEKAADALDSMAADRIHDRIKSKWKFVLKESVSAYVMTLFQEDKRLADWIKKSSEPLFYAVQLGALNLIKFLVSQEKGMINAVRESTRFSLLHTAVISGRLSVIQFLLDHPDIDIRQTNVWGENIFHAVFLAGWEFGDSEQPEKKSSKLEVLRFLFQPKYFLRISDVLIAPNIYNETALDFAKNDDGPKKREIQKLTERKTLLALRLKELTEEEREVLRKKDPSGDLLDDLFLGSKPFKNPPENSAPCRDSFKPSLDSSPQSFSDWLDLLNGKNS